MPEVTIRYRSSVAGHPEPGSEITVERTDMVDGLIRAGHVIEITSMDRPAERSDGE